MMLFKLVLFTAAAAAEVADPLASLSTIIPSTAISQVEDSSALNGPFNRVTTEIVDSYLPPIEVALQRNSYITRKGSTLLLDGHKWPAAGANVYWLGLDENVIPPSGQPFYAPFNASYPTQGRVTEIMNTLATLGATVLRSQTLGVSVGNPLSLWPTLRQTNEDAFDSMDWAIYQARQHGIRIFAPLIDNYDYYHGGKFTFLRWRGIDINTTGGYSKLPQEVQEFYTNATIIEDFKQYIKTLITHVNPYTGLSYAEDSTIFAYETGNELSGPLYGDLNVPVEWTNEIATYVKSLAPHKLIMDGTFGVNKTHLTIESIDILSDHFYPLNNTRLEADVAAAAQAEKSFLVGEYDWTGDEAGLSSFFQLVENAYNKTSPEVSGDLFWSLFMHDVPNCNIYVNHSDGYTLQYGNPLNSAAVNTQISLIREHLWAFQGQEVGSYLPAIPCPGPASEYTYPSSFL